MNIFYNIWECWVHIPHTLKHYIAFLKTEKKYLGSYKYKFHDLDKILMYICIPFLGTRRIKKIHRKINRHHIQNYKIPSQCGYEEAAIDWECCRLTKPKEPLSAREFLEYKEGTLNEDHWINMDRVLKIMNL